MNKSHIIIRYTQGPPLFSLRVTKTNLEVIKFDSNNYRVSKEVYDFIFEPLDAINAKTVANGLWQ